LVREETVFRGVCAVLKYDRLQYALDPDGGGPMVKFMLWCILFVICWPLALLALVLYPLIWLLLLPFRILGIAVGGVLELIGSIIRLPARLLRRL
jgi:hypothetical protein